MNTRTRTNLHIGSQAGTFAELVSQNYKNGAVAIIYEQAHRALAESICDELYKKGNRSKLCETGSQSATNFGEHIRFFIGVGGLEAIRAVRRAAKDMRFAIYATEILSDCFCDGSLSAEKNGFAEIAYFDDTIINISDTLTAAKGYCETLSMFYSLLDEYCIKMVLPYRHSALEALVAQYKSFFSKPVDKDYFLQTMLNLLKCGSEYFSAEQRIPLIYRIRNKYAAGESLSSRFFVCYLLFCLGIMFTKWNFNDMLIPAATQPFAEPGTVEVLKSQSAKISDCLFSRQELNAVSMVIRAMGVSLEGIDVAEHLAMIIEESRRSEGLANIINNTGVMERLINYEEHEGY